MKDLQSNLTNFTLQEFHPETAIPSVYDLHDALELQGPIVKSYSTSRTDSPPSN
ncbi:hypothetical protein F8B43_4097 [Methylorubrum populi]|uniref:Uncharacterized protein n=1 Tax=Methylorubrum populi TaxID=223967 RepID=A0A833J2Y8_9HYPH|nr:hypothetical protein F8B43_4097 [Methylorubrum populi]